MDKSEARRIILDRLAGFRTRPHADLAAMIDGEPTCVKVQGLAARPYQVEIQVFWDDQPGGNVRVIGAIDDGGWRAFAPLTESFIKTPQEAFIGE